VIELTSDSEEAPIKTLEFTSGVLIRKAAPVHFQEVACSGQCLMDSEEVDGEGMSGDGRNRQAVRWCRILAGQVELAL
jgi:hypothetical protein